MNPSAELILQLLGEAHVKLRLLEMEIERLTQGVREKKETKAAK